MNFKLFFERIFTAIMGGVIAVLLFLIFVDTNNIKLNTDNLQTSPPVVIKGEQVDLTYAANLSLKSVVHITTIVTPQKREINPFYDFLFGNDSRYYRQRPTMGSGSGVIISSDGYIATNNHVVQKANVIKVVLNDKRSFDAKLIGRDPYTDLALLKIETDNLPAFKYGDSDSLQLGEWVLAVGNPFNLTSTVTAGIISAKARKLGLMNNKMSIESFLQTDAAVNPGNSGGALVNTKGELVGINTAIESRTGSYSGYSFAIPATIVKKVIADLKEFGKVQRALLGISILNINDYVAKQFNLNKIEGVYVVGTEKGGAANEAGIIKGDVILEVNDVVVNSIAQLQEQIGKYRPGDKVNILVKRGDEKKLFELILRNQLGSTEIIKDNNLQILGADFKAISEQAKRNLQINGGVQVVNLRNGKLKRANVRNGFIIFKINNTHVYDKSDIAKAIDESKDRGVFISGIYPNGEVKYYAFSLYD